MNYRQLAGQPYNYFLQNLGKSIKFYKQQLNYNNIDNGYQLIFFIEEVVIPIFTNKNEFSQSTSGQQTQTSGLSIRTTRGDLKGCIFEFEGIKYQMKDYFNTNGQDIGGRAIFHYETTKC